MSVQRKFKEAHHVRLQTRFMILTNQIPNLSDSSGALTGRFLILDFRQTFYGREDITLKDKLERELPGILHWAIAGWRRLRARGKFVEPASSGESREIMEEMGNPIKTFFEECVDQQPHFEIDGMRLYKCYCKWLEEKGFKILPNSTTFKRNLRASYMNITSEVYRDHRGVRSQKYRGLDVRPLDQFMGIY
jgi:putative DNA primase/helicase